MGPGEGLTNTISLITPGELISLHFEDFNRCNYDGKGEDCYLLSESITPDLLGKKPMFFMTDILHLLDIILGHINTIDCIKEFSQNTLLGQTLMHNSEIIHSNSNRCKPMDLGLIGEVSFTVSAWRKTLHAFHTLQKMFQIAVNSFNDQISSLKDLGFQLSGMCA
eukprot:9837768-Ditylum_brightwellii.AAC.1